MKWNKCHITLFLLLVFMQYSCNKDNSKEYFVQNTAESLANLNEIMYGSKKSDEISALKNDPSYERFKIVHISDIHLSSFTADDMYDNPTNLEQAVAFANLREAKINALVASGDFINTTENDDKQTTIQYLKAFASTFFSFTNTIPSFFCTGNHDTNMLSDNSSYYLSKQDLHSVLFANMNYKYHQQPGENYYYADVVEANGNIIRFIALDNTDQEGFEYNSLHVSCITQKQVDWLINIALKENMTDKHSIIVLNHHPLQSYSKDGSTYMCAGVHLYKETLVPSIINAFIQKKKFKNIYKSTVSPTNTIVVDADFENSKGEFICYLGGHTHTSAHFEVAHEEGTSPKQIMLLANTLSPDLQNDNFGYIARDNNDINSNSFSIYAIDTDEKKIYVTYFGAHKGASIESISYK